jgi:uncharacterized Zn finger protein (UPF0148 family)
MSDFDKEAEREKLREKYEQEQEEREATEKMSELLLQGATMTNAHCSDCGDPIFRYDGQEFCASCEKAVDRGTDADANGSDGEDADADDGDAAGASTDDGTNNIEVTSPDDARVAFGSGNAADEPADADGGQSPSEQETPTEPTSGGREATAGQRRSGVDPSEQPSSRERPPAREVPSVEPSAGGDVSAARDSLVRTLTRFSEQAEATEDPQRAREYLAAAREAAETLSALRR